MRYHAVVHNDENKSVFECHVFGQDTGDAREKVKNYLRNQNQREQAKMLISLSECREDIQSDLLLIK